MVIIYKLLRYTVVAVFVVHKHKDDYSQASRAASKACFKTDIESTDCDENIQTNSSKGRPIIRNKRYLISDDDMVESSDSEVESSASSLKSIPSKPLTGKETKKQERQIARSQDFRQESATSQEDTLFRNRNEDSTSKIREKEPINREAHGKSYEEILTKMCSRISYLTLLTKGIAEDTTLIKLQMENLQISNPSQATPNEEVYNFPFDNTDSFEEFEKTLEKREAYSNFVNFISRIGGESAYEFIKRVMGRLVTDEVAAKYSFTGHKGKRPIGQFLITKALKDASRNVNYLKHCTENDLEKKLRDWLRHAPARANKRQGVPPNNPPPPEEDE
ncbi:uncharacterized protein LOC115889717 isoform X2 [Sitophilus oryzae]|uniref:Uncharacterized protein LOC115876516 isoform X2 n=1 Tax=Sitophilus oryzae TaxID=7048 RepID=A0A6J2XAJ6_SITOR|nr:uncharacterized protein LOC115876516 isoform X2 [Sitophilus oryzae]XP_030757071.1 uncharacterized protein LOC115882940 isoform X2 [Sitophilus oryzae]XP_030765643.1 uncharacterized protein LOC115889717 isoform X2 [Sitophilus oryzae]